MTTPETVGQFADAVRAAVDAERERWRDAAKEFCTCTGEGSTLWTCDVCELLRRIEEGR